MKRLIPMIVLIAVALVGCAPKYYCETQFGQEPPLMRDGVKYWPSNCQPVGGIYDKAPAPAAVKK
jgi:hypothetical protein